MLRWLRGYRMLKCHLTCFIIFIETRFARSSAVSALSHRRKLGRLSYKAHTVEIIPPKQFFFNSEKKKKILIKKREKIDKYQRVKSNLCVDKIMNNVIITFWGPIQTASFPGWDQRRALPEQLDKMFRNQIGIELRQGDSLRNCDDPVTLSHSSAIL